MFPTLREYLLEMTGGSLLLRDQCRDRSPPLDKNQIRLRESLCTLRAAQLYKSAFTPQKAMVAMASQSTLPSGTPSLLLTPLLAVKRLDTKNFTYLHLLLLITRLLAQQLHAQSLLADCSRELNITFASFPTTALGSVLEQHFRIRFLRFLAHLRLHPHM
jgi:hypothetical protein